MGLSCISFAMLYDYLRSLFHVWKPIPFEASLRRCSAWLPHINTPYLGSISGRHVLLLRCVLPGCLMLLGGEEIFSAKSCKRPYWLCLVSYGLFRFTFFFLFLQQSHHTQQCRRDTAQDCKSLLWNSLRCISIYSLGWWKVDVDFFSWNLLLVTLYP